MYKFVQALELLKNLNDDIQSGAYDEEDPKALKEDLNYTVSAVTQQFPNFPYLVDKDLEHHTILKVLSEDQMAIAQEFADKEPELRYHHQWDAARSMHEFEQYLVAGCARKITDEIIELIRPQIEQQYRNKLRKKTRRSDVERLYDQLQ